MIKRHFYDLRTTRVFLLPDFQAVEKVRAVLKENQIPFTIQWELDETEKNPVVLMVRLHGNAIVNTYHFYYIRKLLQQ